MLPIVIVATREAIRAIPIHIREAAYAVGATKWQGVIHHVIQYSYGGILNRGNYWYGSCYWRNCTSYNDWCS